MAKQAHVERMEAEMDELDDRITELDYFIQNNPIFLDMQAVDRSLMRAQVSAMKAYSDILLARLERS